MALRPVLVVGVGGSGVRTLMALQSVLLRRLRALPGGWSDGLPAAWQLLAIDAESEQPTDFDAPPLEPSAFHALMARRGEDRRYPDLLRDLLRDDVRGNVTTFGGWLPRPHDRRLSDGAGQLRAIGRAISAYGLGDLNRVVGAARERMTSVEARSQLDHVAASLGTTANHDQPVPVVVTSVAGGTGAGMFLDVIEVMRSVDGDLARDAQVLLYGADVFQDARRRNFAPHVDANALAATFEIVTGVWGREVTAGTVALYNRAGIGAASRAVEDGGNAFGGRYHYLIGARNLGGHELATDDRAYWAVADALGAIVSDPSVSGSFRRYFITNVFDNSADAAVAGDASGLAVPNDKKYLNPFASIGSGRLSVGSDRLLEYAVQALTRSTIERLLWPDFAAEGEDADSESRAHRAWPEFLDATGLNERDSEQDGTMLRHDDVIEALRTNAQRELVARAARRMFEEAGEGTEVDGQTSEEWTKRVIGALERQRPDVEAGLREAVDDAARELLPILERRLLLAVSDAAGRYGIRVTLELLRRLDDELLFTSEEQLPVQAEQGRRKLDEAAGGLERMFGKLGDERADARHQVVAAARHATEGALERDLAKPERCLAAADILAAFRTEVIPGLERALKASADGLRRDLDGGRAIDRTGTRYSAFPRLREAASGEGRIGPSEVLLEPVARFADLLDDAARRTVGDGLADQWDRVLVRRTVKRCSLAGGDDGESMFDTARGWAPGGARLLRAGSEPQRPEYRGFRSVLDVADLAERLLRDRETPVGRLAARTLREYLEVSDDVQRADREERFIDGFVEVMRRSVPFVEIDTQLARELHPQADLTRTSIIVSALPLQAGSGLAKRLRTALEEAGRWDPTIEEAFGDGDAASVDVFQSLGSAIGPLSFPTITRPAWTRWLEARGNPDTADSFWSSKRARPLLETLPIARPRLDELVAGWFVALLTGRARHEHAGREGLRIEVRDEERGRWAPAPFPLLDRTAEGPAVLPAMLASLPIALAECGYTSSLDALRPYRSLIGLGASVSRTDGPLQQALGGGDGFEDRRAAMLEALAAERAQVEREVARVDGHEPVDTRVWESTITYELADVLLAGIEVVRARVAAAEPLAADPAPAGRSGGAEEGSGAG